MVHGFGKHRLQPPLQQTCEARGHLHDVWCGLVTGSVAGAEIGVFQRVVDGVFVLFRYVEYEWPEARVLVCSVLAPGDCSPDGNDDAGACFADFYG